MRKLLWAMIALALVGCGQHQLTARPAHWYDWSQLEADPRGVAWGASPVVDTGEGPDPGRDAFPSESHTPTGPTCFSAARRGRVLLMEVDVMDETTNETMEPLRYPVGAETTLADAGEAKKPGELIPWAELTHQQLLALDPDELERYHKLALMGAGLSQPIPATTIALRELPQQTNYYEVQVAGSRVVVVDSAEQAGLIAEAITKALEGVTTFTAQWEAGSGFEHRWAKRRDSVPTAKVETVGLYSKEAFDGLLPSIKHNKEAEERNKSERDRHRKEVSDAEAVLEPYVLRYAGAMELQGDIEQRLMVWAEYLETAGAEDMALEFFRKRFTDADIEEVLVNHIRPQEDAFGSLEFAWAAAKKAAERAKAVEDAPAAE